MIFREVYHVHYIGNCTLLIPGAAFTNMDKFLSPCMDKSLHTRWSGVKITYPFPNFIVCTIEVIDLMNNFIPRV